jgi:aminoglycoside phosphotransferase (APT) family kinase protein
MTTSATRDDGMLVDGLNRWYAPRRVVALDRPSAGWSNETLLLTIETPGGDEERAVVRMPPLVPSFPEYDLHAQARVLTALFDAGVPAPVVVAVEDDPQFVSAPFLVTSFVEGRAPGDAPGLDPWVAEAPATVQRHMQDHFINVLAAVHQVDWRGAALDGVLRAGVATEIAYWQSYAEWAADGAAPAVLVDALAWCAETAPANEPPGSLLWGDARLGNVLFRDAPRRRRDPLAALDWELASIGPAEMDAAWYLALDELTVTFTGAPVEGFLEREGFVARHEARLGRVLRDLRWHEVFALARSAAINDRQARVAARTGTPYPGVAGDDNPMLAVLARRIERYTP